MKKHLADLREYLSTLALLTLAYLVVARLSLYLAISPGFASPVWPAAGIALGGILLAGYRFLPAVFIGSFAANLMIAVHAGGHLVGPIPFIVSSGIAAGAVLQAALGSYLIRQVVRFPTSLEDEKEIGLLLMLGGPIGCTVNATVGPLTLLLSGSIPQENYLITWFTWWVGDTIGVVLFLPVLLLLAVADKKVTVARKIAVIAPLLVIFSLVLVLFFFSRSHTQAQVQDEFHRLARDEGGRLQEEFNLYLEILDGVERFFDGSDYVSEEEFGRYVSQPLRERRGIHALAWIARDLPPGSHDRFALRYVRPGVEVDAGQPLLFDPAVCAPCVFAMNDARDSGLPIAISGFGMFREANSHKQILIFHPVYETGRTVDTEESRRKHLRGYVLGEFNLSSIIDATMPELDALGLMLFFYDNYIPGDEAILYGQDNPQAPFSSRILLQAGSRQWTLEFFPRETYLWRHPGWNSWVVLIGGLFFTTLLQAFLLVVTARAEFVKRQVAEQTEEIRKANESLERAVHQLHESNAELERFAYVASHDLKEPLRKVSSYTSLLERQYGDQFDEKARTYIAAANDSADRMRTLIEDILEYARLGNDPDRFESVDVNHTMVMVKENLRETIEQSAAVIEYENLPTVSANPVRLLRLLQNLVANGIKYQPPFARPKIHITAEDKGNEWLFVVRDNGIGMKQEYCKRIFEPFERLHGKKEYAGTGLGLSICQKIVQGFGGRIWAQSRPGQGSVFYFTVPKH